MDEHTPTASENTFSDGVGPVCSSGHQLAGIMRREETCEDVLLSTGTLTVARFPACDEAGDTSRVLTLGGHSDLQLTTR